MISFSQGYVGTELEMFSSLSTESSGRKIHLQHLISVCLKILSIFHGLQRKHIVTHPTLSSNANSLSNSARNLGARKRA